MLCLSPCFLLLLYVGCAFASSINDRILKFEFDAWMQLHGKSYDETSTSTHVQEKKNEEYERRLSIYRKNSNVVTRHNNAYESGETMYAMSLFNSPFSDLTDEEFTSLYLMNSQNCSATSSTDDFKASSSSEVVQKITQELKRKTAEAKRTSSSFPKFVDWRTRGVITPVKDQKGCGSCWTFSTSGTLESHYCIATSRHHGKDFDCTKWSGLSEQQLLDCSGNYDNHGCNGGLPSHAFEYIKYAGGLEEEGDYPYLASDDGPCHDSSSSSSLSFNSNRLRATGSSTSTKIKVEVAEVYNITERDEDDLTSAIGSIGPVSVAFQVAADFRFYSHGVYDSYNATSGQTVCQNGSQDVNHAVVAVGFGETNEESGDGIPYYIVRNSWSSTWGMEGYFWMKRGDNLCGIADCASFPIVPVAEEELTAQK